MASDIYALGIIMCEIISEQPPYPDKQRDYWLALEVFEGPKFNIKVPQLLINVVKQSNYLERSVITELDKIFSEWCMILKIKMIQRLNHKLRKQKK